MEARVR